MRLSFLLPIISIVFCCSGCREKETSIVVPHTPVDSVIVYPYTDLYRGTLLSGGDSVAQYEFSVIHRSSDSLLLVSFGVIDGCPGYPSRYFNFGYEVNPSNSYRFVTYETYEWDPANPHDDRDFRGTAEIRQKHLIISWIDAYVRDFRVSTPTGGLQYSYCGGYYDGALVE